MCAAVCPKSHLGYWPLCHLLKEAWGPLLKSPDGTGGAVP